MSAWFLDSELSTCLNLEKIPKCNYSTGLHTQEDILKAGHSLIFYLML